MPMIDPFLHSPELQRRLADHLRTKRRARKLSRARLAQLSTVPAATIKRFELSGEVSLRQFCLLWECLDDLHALLALTQSLKPEPQTIAEVLSDV